MGLRREVFEKEREDENVKGVTWEVGDRGAWAAAGGRVGVCGRRDESF